MTSPADVEDKVSVHSGTTAHEPGWDYKNLNVRARAAAPP